MENKFNLHYGLGLDPDGRIASDVAALSEEKKMLRLGRFSEACELDAFFFAPDQTPDTAKAGSAIAAAILRDCYGKVNCLIAPARYAALLSAAAKLLKAYRKDTRVVAVSLTDTEAGFQPAPMPDALALEYIDETVSVSLPNAAEAAKAAGALEGISFGELSGAILHAGKATAEKENKRHARYVLLLPEAV